ncbi:MAG: hypothetical protein QHH13_05100 [Melioribacter sp.]|uniref:hypothetical protein n=1 Tax=Rosettibacter primus TaxID=3111523 RepID=UPI00247D1434|nr:hypothetical protein [Melioribacter sp.]
MKKFGILIAVILALAPIILIGQLGILWIVFLTPVFFTLSKKALNAAMEDDEDGDAENTNNDEEVNYKRRN